MANLIQTIKNLFVPSASPAPSTPEETKPRFLLPETLEEYRTLRTEAEKEEEAIIAERKRKLQEAQRKADGLCAEAEALLSQAREKETPLPAEAELLKRAATGKKLEAEKIMESARSEDLSEEKRKWKRLEPCKGAEKFARENEQAKIQNEGRVVFTKIQERAADLSREGFKEPRIWDLVERKVVSYGGKYYLGVRRRKAIMRCQSGESKPSPWGAQYSSIYSPTGKYHPVETEFVTDSVAQMTEEELTAIVNDGK